MGLLGAPRLQARQEVAQHAVEDRRLIQVRGVAGAGNHFQARGGNLLGHVLARGQERLILIADPKQAIPAYDAVILL